MAKKTISSDYTTWTGTSKKDKVYIDYADNVSVNTGKGNDSIYNYIGYYATINAGSGNDTIELYGGDGSSINAGSGNDLIDLYGHADDVTVKGGTSNDTIYGNGYDLLYQYKSGDGNDLITGWSSNGVIKITGGTYTKETVGNDVILTVGKGSITLKDAANTTLNIDGTLAGGKNISNATSYQKLTGTSYADTISNSADYVTISGGKGKDSINNTGSNVSISGGTGNDTIWSTNGYNSYVTIDGGSGNNRLELWGKNSLIKGGKNNDTVFVHGKNVTVTSGSGADFIENWDDNVGRSDDGNGKAKIFAGAGNDSVLNYGSGATINAGTGNDTITFKSHIRDGIIYSSKENVVQYANGDGKDTIFGFSSTDTLKITGAKYTRSTVGNDVVLKVGKGSITLKDAANTTLNIDGTLKGGGSDTVAPAPTPSGDDIYGTSGHDYLSNKYPIKSGINIFGYAGNDYIYAVGSRSSIYGGSDNDSIYVYSNTNGFVDGGTGNDTIKAYYGDNLSLKGGYGNDLVSLSGGAACIIQYSNGDGYDTVIGFNNNDTLNISGNYTRETVGSNVVFNVGSGSITLKDAAKTTINIDTNYFASNDEFWGNDNVDDFIHSSGGNDFGNDSLTLDSLDFTTSSSQMNSAITLKEFTTIFKTNDDAYKITASNIVKK